MRMLFFSLFFFLFNLTAKAELPTRLILAVDGVSFRHMQKLQQGTVLMTENHGLVNARGFEKFYPVAKMVSVFPSESDVAWNDIFHFIPPKGYQRCFYSYAKNTVEGSSGLSDITESFEYEKSMHFFLEGFIQHMNGFLFPHSAFADELKEVEERFFHTQNSPVFYAYILSTDDLQHMAGDVMDLLQSLDALVKRMESKYFRLTGKKLEVALVSDHGHNEAYPGKRVKAQEYLEHIGYKVGDSILGTKDVVIPTSGIMNAFKVYGHRQEIPMLAHHLLSVEGVDLITYQLDNPLEAVVINPQGELALIKATKDLLSFAYLPLRGDPLAYKGVLKKMNEQNLLDANQFASRQEWARQTENNYYPLALERIIRGHTETVLNPAPILVSLKNGYEHVDSLTKWASSVVTTGGTHGGLDTLSSSGILMTNFKPTYTTTTQFLWEQLDGLNHLHNFRRHEVALELTSFSVMKKSARLLSYLKNKILHWENNNGNLSGNNDIPAIHLWHGEALAQKSRNPSGRLQVNLDILRDGDVVLKKNLDLQIKDMFWGESGDDFYLPLNKILDSVLKRKDQLEIHATLLVNGQSWELPPLSVETDRHKKIVVY